MAPVAMAAVTTLEQRTFLELAPLHIEVRARSESDGILASIAWRRCSQAEEVDDQSDDAKSTCPSCDAGNSEVTTCCGSWDEDTESVGSLESQDLPRGVLSASESGPTTVLLRPARALTRSTLLALLDERGFGGRYDFVHVPSSYALVNLCSSLDAQDLLDAGLAPAEFATFQGLAALVQRYRNSDVMHHTVPDELKPAVFSGGSVVVFPRPTRRIRKPNLSRS